MKQKDKIFWRIGQEITPETFIQADNYICSQQSLIRRLISHKYYGLLPCIDANSSSLSIKVSLNNRDIYVEELMCYGITSAGYLIEFDNYMLASVKKKNLLIQNVNSNAFFLVLRIKPFEQSLIEPVENEETPFSHPEYELDIKESGQIEEDELSIMKFDTTDGFPKIDNDYIPPCMSIDSFVKLSDNFMIFKRVINEIWTQVDLKKDQFQKLFYPFRLLLFELDEFDLSEPPVSLIRLIKKIILTLSFFIPEIRQINEQDLNTEYDHNDISHYFKSLIKYLNEILFIVSKVEEVKVVEEEDFTPKI